MSYKQKFWAGWMWWALILYVACLIAFIGTVTSKLRPWTDILILTLVFGALGIVRYIQRKGIEDVVNNIPDHPNDHDDKLWDASPYTCIHGINPDSKTLKCAWPYAHDLTRWPNAPTPEERTRKIQK